MVYRQNEDSARCRLCILQAVLYYFQPADLIPRIALPVRLQVKSIFAWPWPWVLVKIAMCLAAFILYYGGYRTYGMKYVLGIKQAQEKRGDTIQKAAAFRISGILEYVRHPWYLATILLVWALGPVSDVSLVVKIILTAYIIIGTFLEERKIIQEIGAPYLEYRTEVFLLTFWEKMNVSD